MPQARSVAANTPRLHSSSSTFLFFTPVPIKFKGNLSPLCSTTLRALCMPPCRQGLATASLCSALSCCSRTHRQMSELTTSPCLFCFRLHWHLCHTLRGVRCPQDCDRPRAAVHSRCRCAHRFYRSAVARGQQHRWCWNRQRACRSGLEQEQRGCVPRYAMLRDGDCYTLCVIKNQSKRIDHCC